MIAHRSGYATWILCYQNRRFFELWWQPALRGPEWKLPYSDVPASTKHDTPQEAMAAAVQRVKRSDVQRGERQQA